MHCLSCQVETPPWTSVIVQPGSLEWILFVFSQFSQLGQIFASCWSGMSAEYPEIFWNTVQRSHFLCFRLKHSITNLLLANVLRRPTDKVELWREAQLQKRFEDLHGKTLPLLERYQEVRNFESCWACRRCRCDPSLVICLACFGILDGQQLAITKVKRWPELACETWLIDLKKTPRHTPLPLRDSESWNNEATWNSLK